MQINKRRPNLKTIGGRYSFRETSKAGREAKCQETFCELFLWFWRASRRLFRQIRQLTAPAVQELREETWALMTPLPMFAYVVRPVGGGPYPLLIGWSPAKGEMTMMLQNRAPRIFLGIFLAIFVVPAPAHDPSRPELNGWL